MVIILSGNQTLHRTRGGSVPFMLEHDETYHLSVQVAGDTVTTWIDGDLIGSVTDDAHQTGLIGFRSGLPGDSPAAVIDNVRVVDGSGEELFAEDFSSGTNPFVPYGPRACGDVRDGSLVMDNGHWCVLSRYVAHLEDAGER